MKCLRRHRGERIFYAGKAATGQNHLDNPTGFHIHGEINHLAELFILVVFNGHPDEVTGFGRVFQPVLKRRAGHVVSGAILAMGCSVGGILGQCRERQE